MKMICLVALSMLKSFSFSQFVEVACKPIIDTGMLNKWPIVENDAILSKDGRFVAYTIRNLPVGGKTLVIQNVGDGNKEEITGSNIDPDFYFTHDSKKLLWRRGDSLFLHQITSKKSALIGVIENYLSPSLQKGEWIAFSKKGYDTDLVLFNLVNGKQKLFTEVKNAFFNDKGTVLVVYTGGAKSTLKWMDLPRQNERMIWSSVSDALINSISFDRQGEKIAFVVYEKNDTSIVFFQKNMGKSRKIMAKRNAKLIGDWNIQINNISANGRWLFVKAQDLMEENKILDENKASVDLWSYRDEVLQTQQLDVRSNKVLNIVLDLTGANNLLVLNPDGLKLVSSAGDYCLLTSDTLEEREFWWPHRVAPVEWLVNLKDGNRRLIPKPRDYFYQSTVFSPNANWLVWWDSDNGHWMGYETASGELVNLTKSIPALFTQAEYSASTFKEPADWISGWYTEDSALLLCDEYDIWKVDPTGKSRPVNLTGGYGRANKIELRLALDDESFSSKIYQGNESVLLVGYNQENKYNGFIKINLKKPGQMELLTMKPSLFLRHRGQGGMTGGMRPVEGSMGKEQGWVIMRQSDSEYPNLYYTRDLKSYKPLTHFAPQKQYNWLNAELVFWTLPDGRRSQGVLYKPENFDSTKQYPVIFNIYEKKSYLRFEFPMPGLSLAEINIPWFVDRGYLVFLPDIYYNNCGPVQVSSGRYALQSVVSSADELMKRPYIDANRMALQGSSFGGFEVSYIIANSSRFAAAAENSGFTDVFSSYLNLFGYIGGTIDVRSRHGDFEKKHLLLEASPWERPALYQDNSPVWKADKISTPLLIFHNKLDEQVQWKKGMEMYLALRRLAKPCWMLQYDGEAHVLREEKNALDYTIRLTQFFDHYLKGAPAPRWMTEGIPAKLKQVENKYELDTKGNCNLDCKVCKKWNNNREP